MQAELEVIAVGSGRRRFALGCLRAVGADASVRGRVASAIAACVAAGVAVVFTLQADVPAVRVEMFVLVAVLAGCFWLGRPAGPLGATDTRSARWVRRGGCAVLAICLLGFYRPPGPRDIDNWMFAAALAFYVLGVLYVTARASRIGVAQLRTAVVCTAGGVGSWWLAMLLSRGVRDHPSFLPVWVAVIFLVSHWLGRGPAPAGDR